MNKEELINNIMEKELEDPRYNFNAKYSYQTIVLAFKTLTLKVPTTDFIEDSFSNVLYKHLQGLTMDELKKIRFKHI